MRRLTILVLACVLSVSLLTACAHRAPGPAAVQLPALRLQPAALGTALALQQRLRFVFGTQQRELDALLEADAAEVRLAVQALGQSGVRLQWDGRQLQQQRAPWLPAAVRGERVLDDLQFALWPLDAIREALPAGWTVEEQGGVRQLKQGGTAWLISTQSSVHTIRLENRAEGYRLDIETLQQPEPVP